MLNIEGGEDKLYRVLENLEIKDYKVVEHPPLFTCEDEKASGIEFDGLTFKNLLIKDKKQDKYFLVILTGERQMDSKYFKSLTGWGKIRFANEDELFEKMQLRPGSVSPYGLINNQNRDIVVVVERAITNAPDNEIINFHPNRNTATISMRKEQFIKYLMSLGNEIIFEE